jgi:hypothetical protein
MIINSLVSLYNFDLFLTYFKGFHLKFFNNLTFCFIYIFFLKWFFFELKFSNLFNLIFLQEDISALELSLLEIPEE